VNTEKDPSGSVKDRIFDELIKCQLIDERPHTMDLGR